MTGRPRRPLCVAGLRRPTMSAAGTLAAGAAVQPGLGLSWVSGRQEGLGSRGKG